MWLESGQAGEGQEKVQEGRRLTRGFTSGHSLASCRLRPVNSS